MAAAVSIVMPVYNAGPFLGPALDSVLPELDDDVELVIVDDGSTDGSTDLLARVSQHGRVRVVPQSNAGLVAALRAAISAASAPVIARMDADDVNVPGRVARARQALAVRPEVGLVSCWADAIDAQDRVVRHLDVPWLPDDAMRHLHMVGNNVVHGAAVFRRDVYNAAGGYRDGVVAEDYDLWLRMTDRAELVILPDTLYRYRVHSSSITGRSGSAVEAAGRRLMDERWRDFDPLLVPTLARARARYKWYVQQQGPRAGDAYLNSLHGLAGEARLRGHPSVMARTAAAILVNEPSRAGRDLLRRGRSRRVAALGRRRRSG